MSIAELRTRLGHAAEQPSVTKEMEDRPMARPRIIWPKRWAQQGAAQAWEAMS